MYLIFIDSTSIQSKQLLVLVHLTQSLSISTHHPSGVQTIKTVTSSHDWKAAPEDRKTKPIFVQVCRRAQRSQGKSSNSDYNLTSFSFKR